MDLSQSENHGMDKATIEWLHTGASTSPSSLDQSFEHDGIATQLHAQSIDIFRRIYRIKRHTCPSDKSFSKVKEELGKFYLWGNAFADGELDRALESSDDVRFEVLDSLSAIARLLLRGEFVTFFKVPAAFDTQSHGGLHQNLLLHGDRLPSWDSKFECRGAGGRVTGPFSGGLAGQSALSLRDKPLVGIPPHLMSLP